MQYLRARQLIQTGDLFSCAGPWPFSRLIREKTGDDVSHVGVACWVQFSTGQKRLCILEALEGSGVRLYPLHRYLREVFWPVKDAYLWWSPISEINGIRINGTKLMDSCIQRWGDDYAEPYQLFVSAYPWLQRIRKWLGRPIDTDTKREFCSEYVAYALQDQNYPLPVEPALMTPGMVQRLPCFSHRILLEKDTTDANQVD